MEIRVSGRRVEVTDAIKQYATSKVAKLPRYFDRVQAIEVVVDKVHQEFVAEVMVDVEHRTPFIAKITGDDLYACIDQAVDKLERQLTDHKEKLRNRKHSSSR